MATSEGIPSSIDIEFLELNDNPYVKRLRVIWLMSPCKDMNFGFYCAFAFQ